jgi:hypothetical protein
MQPRVVADAQAGGMPAQPVGGRRLDQVLRSQSAGSVSVAAWVV